MSHETRSPGTFYQRFGKRLFDVTVAGSLLVVLSPVIGALWLTVRWQLGSPALFRQRRPGQGGRIFEMVKFRSMTDARDAAGQLLPDEDRLPRFGQLLRSTSLDELPELWNVLKGEMSLVGPRPLLERYLDRYTPHQARRHEVAPGVTGWAQINGRNALGWEEKFDLDVWYVDHQSFALDVKILFLTVWKVIKRDSVSAAGEATMSEFGGTAAERRAA